MLPPYTWYKKGQNSCSVAYLKEQQKLDTFFMAVNEFLTEILYFCQIGSALPSQGK